MHNTNRWLVLLCLGVASLLFLAARSPISDSQPEQAVDVAEAAVQTVACERIAPNRTQSCHCPNQGSELPAAGRGGLPTAGAGADEDRSAALVEGARDLLQAAYHETVSVADLPRRGTALLAALSSDRSRPFDDRIDAAFALRGLAPEQLTANMVEALLQEGAGSESVQTRLDVLELAGQSNQMLEPRVLEPLTRDPEPQVRLSALHLLRHTSDGRARDLFERISATDSSPELREFARYALRRP